MELVFDVGQAEAHRVIFRFNKFWGGLSIRVDGQPVVRDLRMFSVRTTKTYRFSVGQDEVHQVQIDKIRPVALAGFRRQQVKAYVDGVFVAKGAGLTSVSRSLFSIRRGAPLDGRLTTSSIETGCYQTAPVGLCARVG